MFYMFDFKMNEVCTAIVNFFRDLATKIDSNKEKQKQTEKEKKEETRSRRTANTAHVTKASAVTRGRTPQPSTCCTPTTMSGHQVKTWPDSSIFSRLIITLNRPHWPEVGGGKSA